MYKVTPKKTANKVGAQTLADTDTDTFEIINRRHRHGKNPKVQTCVPAKLCWGPLGNAALPMLDCCLMNNDKSKVLNAGKHLLNVKYKQ